MHFGLFFAHQFCDIVQLPVIRCLRIPYHVNAVGLLLHFWCYIDREHAFRRDCFGVLQT